MQTALENSYFSVLALASHVMFWSNLLSSAAFFSSACGCNIVFAAFFLIHHRFSLPDSLTAPKQGQGSPLLQVLPCCLAIGACAIATKWSVVLTSTLPQLANQQRAGLNCWSSYFTLFYSNKYLTQLIYPRMTQNEWIIIHLHNKKYLQ